MNKGVPKIQVTFEERWFLTNTKPDGRERTFRVKQVVGSIEWPMYKELSLEEVSHIIRLRPDVKVTIVRHKD